MPFYTVSEIFPKIKEVTYPWRHILQGVIYHACAALTVVNLLTKFELPSFTCSKGIMGPQDSIIGHVTLTTLSVTSQKTFRACYSDILRLRIRIISRM